MKTIMEFYRRIRQWLHCLREGAWKVLHLLPMRDKTFNKQLKKSRTSECLVKNVLYDYGYRMEFTQLEQQHKGDLFVYDDGENGSFYIEVKQDERIRDTTNVYVELEIQRKDGKQKGWYYYDYTKMIVVDAARATSPDYKKSMYLIDWATMKAELDLNDKRCKKCKHYTDDGNICTALLVPLRYVKARGWLEDVYYYDKEDWEQAKKDAKERVME